MCKRVTFGPECLLCDMARSFIPVRRLVPARRQLEDRPEMMLAHPRSPSDALRHSLNGARNRGNIG
jgi:hypothetical protein